MLTKKQSAAILLGWALCFLFSCKKIHHNVTRGFYYWKTVYKPTRFEINTLRQLRVSKIYLRLFDVDENGNLKHDIPIAPVRIPALDSGFQYIPVVFITQKALVDLNDTAIKQLAISIGALAENMCKQSGINPDEMQIDCDWTSGTKNKYFALLNILKEQAWLKGKSLSCTIRMNQVKYQNYCGIPPADKGLVMVYGMGNVKKPGVHNSILNTDDAEDYLKYLRNYPLQLDIALPLFEWCVLFREQQFRGILHDVTTESVKTSGLFRLKEGNVYTCLKDSLWNGYKLKMNDDVRTEAPTYADILSVANYSSQKINNPNINVILFACDSITLSKFSENELEAIYSSYH